MMLRIFVILTIGMLSACVSNSPVTRAPAPVESLEIPPAPTAPPVEEPQVLPDTGPVVIVPAEPTPPPPPPRSATPASTLLASVDAAIAAGQLEQAAALSERAIRISPRDGNLWYRLATIRFQQRRYSDAAGFARRALSFAGADPALRQASDTLLARANAALDE